MHERTVHIEYRYVLHQTDSKRFQGVSMIPMPYFVSQHCYDLIVLQLQQQTLVYGNKVTLANTHVLRPVRTVLP